MSNKSFSAKSGDGFVYRVTREEGVVDYSSPDFNWGMSYSECPKRMITHVRLCSKRSATQQVKHLVAKDGSQRYARERLISVERAPYSAFEDVTSQFAGGDE